MEVLTIIGIIVTIQRLAMLPSPRLEQSVDSCVW